MVWALAALALTLGFGANVPMMFGVVLIADRRRALAGTTIGMMFSGGFAAAYASHVALGWPR